MIAPLLASLEGTSFTIELPMASSLETLAAAAVIGVVVAVGVAARHRPVVAVALIPFAIGAFALVGGYPHDDPYVSTGALFGSAYFAAGKTAAAGAAAIACGAAAVLASLRGPNAALRIGGAVVVMLVGGGALAAALAQRSTLGPREARHAVLMAEGPWRGHAGHRHEVRARLGEPAWSGFFSKTYAPVALTDDEIRARGIDCDGCVATIDPKIPGKEGVTVHARSRNVRITRTLDFTAMLERGNPKWPLRVGERRVFGLVKKAATSTGGIAVAVSDGLKHLAPQSLGPTQVKYGAAEIRIARTTMKDGFRSFVIELRAGDATEGVREIEVHALDDETWITNGERHDEPLIRQDRPPLPGAYFCKMAGLPFTTCTTGETGLLPGPTGGHVSGGTDGASLFVALISLGMIVPGSSAEETFCLEAIEPGTGDAMPVGDLVVADPKGDPLNHGFTDRLLMCPKKSR